MNLFKRNKIKTPWYGEYKTFGIPKTLKYSVGSMYDVVKEAALKYPYNIAISYYGTLFTYKKFINDVDICSRAFKEIGLKKGDVVTVCMPNTPEAIVTVYALNKLGIVANMTHPLSSENELKDFILDSKSVAVVSIDLVWNKIANIVKENNIKSILLTVKDSMNLLTAFGFWLTKGRKLPKLVNTENVLFWKDLMHIGKFSKIKTETKVDKDDPAIILHSGGTTGNPKGILLSNYNFNAIIEQEKAVAKEVVAGRTVLSIMPIFHGFGLATSIHLPLSSGATCIMLPQVNPKKFADTIKKYRPNIIGGVPSLYESLISSKSLNNVDLSFLKCIICGGDLLLPNLKAKVDTFLKERNCNYEIRAAYGLTECTSGVTIVPNKGYIKEGIGIPCPDVFVKIVAPNSHIELPYNEIGEICISGPSVMLGYLNNPKETAQMLQRHEDHKVWLHTGDLGLMDEKGYIYYKQRLKRMIISSGYNVYPSYIEEIIEKHPAVLTCTVVGIDHPHKVQVPKAFIVLKEGIAVSKKIKDEIKTLCKENIAAYSQPYDYEFRKTLPTTKLGKVAYTELMKEENEKSGEK